MSKRYILPQQHGERKKAKLDVSISDHNFPLSQNKDVKTPDNWGDDNDDEILLLASQACEDAFINNDPSTLPDYSLCMKPMSTSTQMYDQQGPSSSKNNFIFKKPNVNSKCSRISSPLPGMVSKVNGQFHTNDDDFLFDDKIYKNPDSEQIYRQLLQLQEENAKLKSENGKLLEKCVTKEGEASILRTQLKTCQVAVDNARLEKIKAQEKVQMEWTEKLTSANGQLHDLRTQLDFKNLEIISVKEKCRMLESNKVKLTQVNVASHDMSTCHRSNHSNDFMSPQRKPQKMVTSGAQTESKAPFLILNKTIYSDLPRLTSLLPLILEKSTENSLSLLDCNEKLQRHADYSQNKCRIYSTFHRIPSTPVVSKDDSCEEFNFATVYENLSHIANSKVEDIMCDKYLYIFKTVKNTLLSVQNELHTISQRVTTAFQKEMDEKYIEATSTFIWVDKLELLKARFLYKEEQGILARRMTAILLNLIESHSIELFHHFENTTKKCESQKSDTCIDIIGRICSLLDSTSCALLYSGLLLAIICLFKKLLKHTKNPNYSSIIVDLIKIIIKSRPMPFVSSQIVNIMRILSPNVEFQKSFCPGFNGNLKVDYDQGVLLYKKDSCCLQVLYKQIEASLKCIEKQNLQNQLSKLTEHLMAFYNNINCDNNVLVQDKSKCNCNLILMQIIVYALRICAVFLSYDSCSVHTLLPLCRSGIHILYQCTTRDVEFSSQLSYNEGHYIEFCEIMKKFDHPDTYSNMLTDLFATFQSSPEDLPVTFHNEAWIQSFENFTVTD